MMQLLENGTTTREKKPKYEEENVQCSTKICRKFVYDKFKNGNSKKQCLGCRQSSIKYMKKTYGSTMCPEDDKRQATYDDQDGNAYAAATLAKPPAGASRGACEAWDHLQRVFIQQIQHIHVSPGLAATGTEYKINGTNYRVDGFCAETGTIYEYLGNHVHGYPPDHPKHNGISTFNGKSNRLMYSTTMERLRVIHECSGHKVVWIWSNRWKEVIRKRGPVRCQTVFETFA
jgi:hypothetical protein